MGKGVMFMMFMWLMVCIAGGVVLGHVEFTRTALTAPLAAADSTITVRSTVGFPDYGIIVVEAEHIAYSRKTATTFYGTAVSPVVRGTQGTDAVYHSAGVTVSTVPGGLLNSSAAYNVAVMADTSGSLAFVSAPIAFFRLLGDFFFLPLQFLGTDLVIITYLWMVIAIGMIAALTVSLAGGRRV